MIKYIYLSLFLLIAISSSAQITIMDLPPKPEENSYVYDSLFNIKEYNQSYAHLIGQKLFYIGNKNGGKTFYRKSIGEGLKLNSADLINNYFTVVDVIHNPRKYLRDRLVLIQDGKKDTIVYCGDAHYDNDVWVAVGFYEKITSQYEGKELIFLEDDSDYRKHSGLINVETQKRNHNIPKGSRWKCIEVSLHPFEEYFPPNDVSRVILILENKELGRYYCYHDNPYSRFNSRMQIAKFMFAHDYDTLRAELIRKYGTNNGNAILRGEIRTGMTKNMCRDAWGEPNKINKTTGSYGTHEQWVYGNSYVYFENGRITTIQN